MNISNVTRNFHSRRTTNRMTAPNFAGTYILVKNDNFDEYLQLMGKAYFPKFNWQFRANNMC